MKCIYCKTETNARAGIAHIFPEALHANDEVLPRGSVCDSRNQYLGRRLDENLIRYPSIALAIQFLAAPGKSGKSRKLIGSIEREIPGDVEALLRTFTEKPTIVTAAAGSRRAIVQLKSDPQFRMPRFRRALHHVAFNVIAKMEGPEHMLSEHWDAARNYIRSPKNETESWGFAQLTPSMDSIPRAVQGVRWECGRRELVSLQLFQSMFVVDLMNTGDLETLAREQDADFIGPAQQEPPLVTFELSEDSD